MKEIIIIETQNGEKIKSLLNREKVNYQIIYDQIISTNKENVFAHYGEALKDKEREKEAQELENAEEEEDIINEEW